MSVPYATDNLPLGDDLVFLDVFAIKLPIVKLLPTVRLIADHRLAHLVQVLGLVRLHLCQHSEALAAAFMATLVALGLELCLPPLKDVPLLLSVPLPILLFVFIPRLEHSHD